MTNFAVFRAEQSFNFMELSYSARRFFKGESGISLKIPDSPLKNR